MTTYICENCLKEFSSKARFEIHNKRKTLCIKQSKNNIQKPILKWVGGKTQLIDKIIEKIPKEFNNYHELFTGGGSVLLAVLSLYKQNKFNIRGNIYAYDINPILVNFYKNLQNNKDELYEIFDSIIQEYNSIEGTEINLIKSNKINRTSSCIEEGMSSKESYYYWIRSKFNKIENKDSIECSAMFLFINKTCFRGMYREGPNGFNTSYGHYKNSPNINKEEFDRISDLIQNVHFIHKSFVDSINCIDESDFVYLDPPYIPENNKSFVSYVQDGFSEEMHKKLFENIIELNQKNIKFLLSNSNTQMIREYFNEFNIEEIVARRAINSKNPESTTIEVLINN